MSNNELFISYMNMINNNTRMMQGIYNEFNRRIMTNENNVYQYIVSLEENNGSDSSESTNEEHPRQDSPRPFPQMQHSSRPNQRLPLNQSPLMQERQRVPFYSPNPYQNSSNMYNRITQNMNAELQNMNTTDDTTPNQQHNEDSLYSTYIRNLRRDNSRNNLRNTVRGEINSQQRNEITQNNRTQIRQSTETQSAPNNQPTATPTQLRWYYSQGPNTTTTQQQSINNFLSGVDQFLNVSLTDLLEPVVIAPTTEEIRSATRDILFNDIIRPVNTRCPITLNEFQDNSEVTMILSCGHIFSRNELMNWFTRNVRCPMCRFDIRTYAPERYRHRFYGVNERHHDAEQNGEVQNNGQQNSQEQNNGQHNDTEQNSGEQNDEEEIEYGDEYRNEELYTDGNELESIHINNESDGETIEPAINYHDEILNNINLTHELYNDLYSNNSNNDNTVSDVEEEEEEEEDNQSE